MKYLVAVDGSEPSEDALQHAIELARDTGADVTAIHVVAPDPEFVGGDTSPTDFSEAAEDLLDDVTEAEEEGQAILEDAEAVAEAQGAEIDTGLLVGEPVEEIAEYAAAEGYDAVFVGHRGASERYEGLVGSVAKDVVGRATVPVTVVR